ncbi:GNAT family N-acetyltransferase [Bacillus taeanensis]|uniref:RimJ/RimL family protein N-acetyltransferase n=1 Tax=Bacillus taeanensis TaxID=273032 RepID=A0A366XV45_9BACI|nr:GNAT family protein [Bacillus taeanensis]RBW67831.1 RimJ/RimL family protein N-acetyltransferase [Bacillus taeanensis]
MFTYPLDEHAYLKLLEPQDAEGLFHVINSSRTHLRQWLPWVDFNRTADDSRTFIKHTQKQFFEQNGFQAGIFYKENLAGVIGFHQIDWSNSSTSIGYWLGEHYTGQGLMTKACAALVNHAFTYYKLNRVEIRCAARNTKSCAIPERLGFTKEGVIRDNERIDGRFVDHVVYGMLKREWQE